MNEKIIEQIMAEMSDVSDVGVSNTLGFSVLVGKWNPADGRRYWDWDLHIDEDHSISVFDGSDYTKEPKIENILEFTPLTFVVDQVDQAKLFELLDFFQFGYDSDVDFETGCTFVSNSKEDIAFRQTKIKSLFESFCFSNIIIEKLYSNHLSFKIKDKSLTGQEREAIAVQLRVLSEELFKRPIGHYRKGHHSSLKDFIRMARDSSHFVLGVRRY